MQVYADNAATTKTAPEVVEAMLPYFSEIYGNPSSLHSVGQAANKALAEARASIARDLNCQPNEIYFTSGGSEADNQAILSAAAIGEKKGKKHIISTAFEHHAVLHTLNKLAKHGFEITLLDVHNDGLLAAEDVKNAIRPDTCLVAIMTANNEVGTVEPISEIGAVCKKAGVLFHTDAVQAAGHLPIDVQAEHIDMLSLSAHKFHGPKGSGVLYARRGIPLINLIEGGAQEQGKRAGTENIPGIIGTAKALHMNVENMDKNIAYVSMLRDRLIDGLSQIPESVLNGHPTKRLPGNCNMSFFGIEGESLLLLLNQKGICASTGSACSSATLDPIYVLLAIGRPHEIAHGSLRLSLNEENTVEEVDYIIKSVTEVVAYLRSISPLWHDYLEGEHEICYTLKK